MSVVAFAPRPHPTANQPKKDLYEVRFTQTELWPDYAGSPYDTLYVDIYEHWLEQA